MVGEECSRQAADFLCQEKTAELLILDAERVPL